MTPQRQHTDTKCRFDISAMHLVLHLFFSLPFFLEFFSQRLEGEEEDQTASFLVCCDVTATEPTDERRTTCDNAAENGSEESGSRLTRVRERPSQMLTLEQTRKTQRKSVEEKSGRAFSAVI